jgi:hypothetical protein
VNSHRVSAAATQVLKKKSTRQQHGGVNTGIAQAPVNSVTAGWMTRMTRMISTGEQTSLLSDLSDAPWLNRRRPGSP